MSPSWRQGQWSVLREARKRGRTQHGVEHRETPTLGGVGGCREVLEAGLSCLGIARAEQAPRLQQNQGVLRAEVPKASRVTGALSRGAPGSGMREGREDRGQRCSGLGPASITGCLSDPGPVTLTAAGLFPQPSNGDSPNTPRRAVVPPGRRQPRVLHAACSPSFPHFLPLVPKKASSTSHLPPSQRPLLFQNHVKDGPDTP